MPAAALTAVASTALPNVRPDIAFIIGIQDTVTVLAEHLCGEFGLRFHRAMKASDPSQPISDLDDDAVIVPELGDITGVHVCGLKVSNKLVDYVTGGPVECNFTDGDASVIAHLLLCILAVAADGHVGLPAGWSLRDIPEPPAMTDDRNESWLQQLQESECLWRSIGFFGPMGTVVADFGGGKQLLQLPPQYEAVFPLLQNRHGMSL